jgi:putative ABC transport system permease protein
MIAALRHAFRSLARTPGFTGIAVLTLALGIGASTAIFSVVHALLLTPLRYGDARPLVQLRSQHAQQGFNAFAPATFLDVAATAKSFEATAAQTYYYYNLTRIGTAVRLTGVQATADYFKLWRVQPLLGRTWNPEETVAGAPPVVVLSEQVWRKNYAANRNLIGQTIMIDDVPVTVIGVMPASFQDPWGNGGLWRPMPLTGETKNDRASRFWSPYARLKPGVTLAQANAELSTLAAQFRESYPQNYQGWTLVASDLQRAIVSDYETGLLVVLGAVGCVMLITCANVAGLNIVRATSRRKELAVRTALGASRGQLIRQLLVESLLLALVGGVAGVLLGSWGIDALLASLPQGGWLPRADEIALNGPVLAGSLALSLLTGVVFGLAPGFTSARVDANEALKATARTSAHPAARRLRSILVVAEIALAFVLLAAAGLLSRSFVTILNQRPGIDASRVLSLTVSLPETRFATPEKRRDYYTRALAEAAAVPGVEAAGFTNTSPFRWGIPVTFVAVGRDGTVNDVRVPQTYYDSVSLDYFRAMGVPLLAGRLFNADDRAGGNPVVIISETTARRLFGDENPLGRQLASGNNATRFEVIGVVGDVRREGLAQAAPQQAYRSLDQRPTAFATLMVRTTLTPAALGQSLQAALARVDPDIPVSEIASMEDVISRGVTQPRLYVTLFTLFAAIALLLAVIGLYGLIAYAVAQRTREFGIRTALGAAPREIVALVLREGSTLIALGVAIGLAGAFATTRLLSQMLTDTSVHDPLIFGLVPVILAAAAFAACLLPARRAAKVDPVVALRAE